MSNSMKNITIDDGLATICVLGHEFDCMILPSESRESQVLKLKSSRDRIVSWLAPTGQGAFRAIEKVYSHAVSKKTDHITLALEPG
jgi:hypothetical protein